jgi:hypothetical protein
MTFNTKTSLSLAMAFCMAVPALAEADLSGSWAAINDEDSLERGGGPNPADWAGLPFNEAGRAKALSYEQSVISMPERICWFQTQWHIAAGPFSLRMWPQSDPLTGRVNAWIVGAWETRAPMTIWLDGRPHPSKNAPHDQTGFTTGVWNGNELIATTTHLKTGYIRRNGAPSSDEAVITTHFRRHGDMLTVALFMDDPVYLTEPYVLTRSYNLSTTPGSIGGPPCIVGDEGVESGRVPHYLPGQNPLLEVMTSQYGIPPEAELGGPETMYPEFRDKIKDKFVLPAKCTRNCGGGRGGGAN